MGNFSCTLNDPNTNEKMRFGMATQHALGVIEQANQQLTLADYDLEVFWRKHYDESTKTTHFYELYDFAKKSANPGPDRFVIAYDRHTRNTYLRADLRSNENLDRLPALAPEMPR